MYERWKKRLKKLLLICVACYVLLLLFGHPFFAIQRPSGSKVLVAEGWMHNEGLREAARLFNEKGYEHLYITGTVRSFSYYLALGDTIVVRFKEPVSGTLDISVAGLPDGLWNVLADNKSVLSGTTNGSVIAYATEVPLAEIGTLLITSGSTNPPPQGDPVLFVGRLKVGDINVHLVHADVMIHRADGSIEPGQPTYADKALGQLVEYGVPADRITVIPTLEVNGSRTLSSAKTFTAYADARGIEAFDVATLGVHARRTLNMYKRARNGRPGAGVVSLHDRWCQRWSWWGNYYGWYQMIKELIGWPAPWLVSDGGADPTPDDVVTLQHANDPETRTR